MGEWKAFAGRLTIFPSAPPAAPLPSAHELYRKIWNDEPDSFQKAPNALSPATANGKRGPIMTQCSIHPTRIDFNLQASSTSEIRMHLPLIEDADELRNELERIINVVGKGLIASPVFRVALFTQFLSPQPSPRDASSAVIRIIPPRYGINLTSEEDLVFQINRPYMSSAVPTIKMNSIMKWSVERIEIVTLTVPPPGALVSTSLPVNPPHGAQTVGFVVGSVTFDENNLPSAAPLSSQQQSALLREAHNTSSRIQHEVGLVTDGVSSEIKGLSDGKPH
jgi:hypothetical protein